MVDITSFIASNVQYLPYVILIGFVFLKRRYDPKILQHFDFNAYKSFQTDELRKEKVLRPQFGVSWLIPDTLPVIRSILSLFDLGGRSLINGPKLCDDPVFHQPRPFALWEDRVLEMKVMRKQRSVFTFNGPNTLAVFVGRVLGDFTHETYLFHKGKDQPTSELFSFKHETLSIDSLLADTYEAFQENQDDQVSKHIWLSFNNEDVVSEQEQQIISSEMTRLGCPCVGILRITPNGVDKLHVTPQNIGQLTNELAEIIRKHISRTGTVSVSTTGPRPLAYALGLALSEGCCARFVGFERSRDDYDEPGVALITSFRHGFRRA
jgi:hypothetical protein